MIIQNMTKLPHVKITYYIDDTKKKEQRKAAMLAGPSSAFHTQLNTTDAPSTTVGGQGDAN